MWTLYRFLVGGLVVLGSTAAWDRPLMAQQPASESILDVTALEQHYRLFSDLCYHCPSPLQDQTLAAAEKIYELLHGYHPTPPGVEDHQRVSRETQAHLKELESVYPFIPVVWNGSEGKLSAEVEPLQLAHNLLHHFLVSVHNESGQVAELMLTTQPSDPTRSAFALIPVGQTRTVLVSVRPGSTEETQIQLQFAQANDPSRMAPLAIPARIANPAVLRGTVMEGETGQQTPARIWVEGSDHIFRHSNQFADNPTLSEKPVVFRPASWRFPFFYTDGEFEISIPPGTTRITLERGFEHPLVVKVLDLAPGENRKLTLSSSRFCDMKKLGWISGDTHIHWAENNWCVNEEIELLNLVQRAEDLRVANNLTLYQWRPEHEGGPFIKPDQYPMGPVPGFCNENYMIQMAEEYRNDNHYGHINLLNIRELIQPIAAGPGSGGPPDAYDYPINRTIIEETHRQGGISVEAHNLGPFHCSDVPVNVILGNADSLDQLDPDHYYRFLNSGIHIGLSNGSDHPARVVGCARVYVRVEQPWTYEKWIDALRRGRTFTTSGPLLFLKVNEAKPGDILDASQPLQLQVRVQALSRYPIGNLQIVSNGEVLASTTSTGLEASLEIRITADQSRWFVARCSPTNEYNAINGKHIAHTSAVYVRINRKEVIHPEAVRFWIENIRQHYARVAKMARFENENQRQEALAYIESGLKSYQELLLR